MFIRNRPSRAGVACFEKGNSAPWENARGPHQRPEGEAAVPCTLQSEGLALAALWG